MDIEITDCAALNSLQLQNISSKKRRKVTFKTTAVLVLKIFLPDCSCVHLVRETYDLCIGHTINMLTVSSIYRQPCLTLSAHKVQLPSTIAKLYEIQLTLGISDLFAKQHYAASTKSHGQIIPGHLMYCYESTFPGKTTKKKIRETSDLKTFSKKRELIAQETPDDCETGSWQAFCKRSLLWLPWSAFCAILYRGFSRN